MLIMLLKLEEKANLDCKVYINNNCSRSSIKIIMIKIIKLDNRCNYSVFLIKIYFYKENLF